MAGKPVKKAMPMSGGLMRRMRQGAKSVTGQGGKKQAAKAGFWDVLFWVVAVGALLALIYRRFA